jgi:carboxylesterase type B
VYSEDCLVLNAFAPLPLVRNSSAPLRPVFFYIHGGGFVGGSATQHAHNLSLLTGHVVFAIQYRLGALGFFSTTSPPPNLGLADQRMALRWVVENARAFGGDPSKVMIFGCSAGGASVAGLLVNSEVNGLYRAAALESPGGHQGWMTDAVRSDDDWMSAKLNLANSDALAVQMGCGSAANTSCLQAVDLTTFYSASRKLRFAPALVVRGEESFPLREIRLGLWSKVPVIIGGQSCESCGSAEFALGPPGLPVSQHRFEAALVRAGFNGSANGHGGVSVAMLTSWYAARIASEGYWRTYARILSDSGHACSSTLHAQALGATGTAWRYFFAYTAKGAVLPGATHGSDESWILDEHEASGTAAEVALSRDMALWWASLSETLDPNTAARAGAPTWQPYAPSTHQAAMWMGREPRARIE